jgi:DNA-binding transcriptional ArsR family regulator
MARMTTAREGRRAGVSVAPVVPPRAVVRDFSGGAATHAISFDARTVYDFLISLMLGAGEDSDLLPEDAAWLKRSRATLDPAVLGDLDSCFGEKAKGVFHSLPSLIVDHPEIRDAAGLVKLVEQTSDTDLVRHLLPELARDGVAQANLLDAMAGDDDARRELEPRLPDWNRTEFMAFLTDAGPRMRQMREVLHAWLPIFQEVEDRVSSIVERDAAGRAADRASLDPSSLIERTTGGLRFLPEPNVRRVILAPSYFSRPYNYIFSGPDWRMFCYPAADAALGATDGTTPPQATIRLYRALGDATRMRILKLLTDRDHYLTELATQLELSKPTMKHHLALLRAAGLVTVTEEGTLTYYSLRRERLAEAGVELTRYLS